METLTLRRQSLSISFFYKAMLVHLLYALLKVFFILFGGSSLFFEEAQYWLWSKNLALSYYSKPPLIAYINYLSTSVLGDSEFAIRINAVISGFLIGVIVFLFAERILRDSRKAYISSVLLIAFPYFWIISYFFTTDSLVTLFWTWAVYAFFMAMNHKPFYWIWTGVAVGLGFLSKYVMVFFWPMAILYLLFFKREELHRPRIYLSILLSAVFLLPVVIWNAAHDWVTVRHVWALATGHSGGESAFNFADSLKQFGEYIGGQTALVFLPFLFPIIRGLKTWRRDRDLDREILLFGPVVLILIFFGLISLITRVEVNWTFFVFPALSIFVVRNSFSDQEFKWQLLIVPILMVLFLSLPVAVRFVDLPARLNPLQRIIGWEELADDIQEVRSEYGEDALLVADSYTTASMMSFYLPGYPDVYDFSPESRMNQFDLWEGPHAEPDRITVFIAASPLHPEYEAEYFGKKLSEYTIDRPVNSKDGVPFTVSVFKGFHAEGKPKKEKY